MKDGRGRVLAVTLLLAILGACSADPGPTDPTATVPPASAPPTTPSPTGATGSPFRDSTDPVAVEAGTYRVPSSAWSVVDYSITFPKGWMVQYGASFLKHPDTPGGISLEAFVPDTIYADACEGSGASTWVSASVSRNSPRRCSSSEARGRATPSTPR